MREALELPSWKLIVLSNEAMRQRAIDVSYMGAILGGKAATEALGTMLKIHGPYTEGFYDQELKDLMEAVK